MALLCCALVYLAGIVLGRLAWEAGLLGCATPGWLWLVPLALLPLAPLLDRLYTPRPVALRWPTRAGFVVPGPSLTPALGAALLLCGLSALLRYAAHPLTPCWGAADLAYYNLPAASAFDRQAEQVTLTGYVSSYPLSDKTRQRLQITVESLALDGRSRAVRGVLRTSVGLQPAYLYGQPVRVRGRLVVPPHFATFSYREYLARHGVYSLLEGARIEPAEGAWRGGELLRALMGLRRAGETLINRTLPEPSAALANGMLLGIDAGIPDTLYEQFNLTGTSHVLVISGSNVAILATALLALFQRLTGRRMAVYPTLAGIGGYALMVGGEAAVLRAALMGSLVVLAGALNRRSTAIVSLAAACWALILFNPLVLWDTGFQLSSLATASLVLFSPVVAGWLPALSNRAARQPSPTARPHSLVHLLVVEPLVATAAASILVLPWVVWAFERLSLVSLLANVAIAAAQPMILLWGSAALLLGLLHLPLLATAALWGVWLGLAWTVQVVTWLAGWPGASLAVYGLSPIGLVATYAAICGLRWRQLLANALSALARWGSALRTKGLRPAAALLAAGTVLAWSAVYALPDGRLHLHFLDIGQGDGILVQTPSGRKILIDGGSDPQRLLAELGRILPFWDRTLDLALLTHPDSDHMNAQLVVPQRFSVAAAIESVDQGAESALWRQAMQAQGGVVTAQSAGSWLDLGDGVALWVLWPPTDSARALSDNERSLVLKLVYGNFSVLLTGDAGLASETRWLQQGLPLAATVLKVGHHGSDQSTSPALVAAVQPQIAVIQVGADNRYGHPAPAVLEALRGRHVLRTDEDGAAEILSDGTQMWIRSQAAVYYEMGLLQQN